MRSLCAVRIEELRQTGRRRNDTELPPSLLVGDFQRQLARMLDKQGNGLL